MRNECSIIRDLLPLYAENMVSSDTAAFVEEHLKKCAACRKEYEGIREPRPKQEISSAAPLLKLHRKMKARRIQTIALTALFVTALLVSAFAVLDAPIYLPYSEDLITVEPVGDSGLSIVFDKAVTNFDYTIYSDPGGKNFYCCDIQAWTSLWDKWFSKEKGELSTIVNPKKPYPVTVEYLPNDGSENICIYGDTCIDRGISLPRLSLGYYLILAVTALAVLGIAWLFTRRKAEVRVWIERMGLYPAAYIISHFIVSGINWASYSLPRDFALIVFISILLYSGLLLAHNIWRLKREIKEMNQYFKEGHR